MEISLERSANVLEPGKYTVYPIKISSGEGNSGYPYIQVIWMELQSQQLIWDYLSLSPKARWKLDAILDLIGAPTSGKTSLEQLESTLKKFTFYVSVIQEKYESRWQNRIKGYLTVSILDEQDLQRLEEISKLILERLSKVSEEIDIVEPMQDVLIPPKKSVFEDLLKDLQ